MLGSELVAPGWQPAEVELSRTQTRRRSRTGPEDQAWDPMGSELRPVVRACSASPVEETLAEYAENEEMHDKLTTSCKRSSLQEVSFVV